MELTAASRAGLSRDDLALRISSSRIVRIIVLR